MADASIVGFIALGLISLSTFPALLVFGRFLSQKSNRHEEFDKLYEDEDGVANTASQQAFPTALPLYLLFGGTTFGLCVSIAAAVLSTVQTTGPRCNEEWLNVSRWVRFACRLRGLFVMLTMTRHSS